MKLRIWGARGSIPAPLKNGQIAEKIVQVILGLPDIDLRDPKAVRAYVHNLSPLVSGTAGGNTACVEIQAAGETFIIDAGSGLRELGLDLMNGPCGRGEGTVHLFISHPHWDHIQGFPFFSPAYIPGNRIYIYGVHDFQNVLEAQQRAPFFPAPLSTLPAEKVFVSLQGGHRLSIGPVEVYTLKNPHPGDSYSFRFEDEHSAVIYASDAEYKQLDDPSIEPHIDFFRNADALIFDAQYTLRDAWHSREDWGHSSAMIGIDLARAAGVKRLLLFHHDPTYSDTDLMRIQQTAATYQVQDTLQSSCEIMIAYEGLTLDLTPSGAMSLERASDGKAAILKATRVFDEQGVNHVAQELIHSSGYSIIDLSQVETFTTASLKSLVALSLSRDGPPFVVAAPSPSAQHVIELAGYADYFAIYPSVDVALAAIHAREALDLPDLMLNKRYRIEQRLVERQIGALVKATDTYLERPVVIHLLSPSFSDETIQRFIQQAPQIIALDHPNIVPTLACDLSEGQVLIIEAYVEGPSLATLLADCERNNCPGLPVDRALAIAREVSLALEYAHSQGVLHGALTPDNVVLTEDGVRVRGFGIGRLEEGRNLLEAPLLYLSASHLAPEQILGQPLDARVDLYALGGIIYQLFTGRLPFSGTEREMLQAHLNQPPPAPRALNSDLSPHLEHLVLKLLEKNPNQRYASAQQAWRISNSLTIRTGDAIGQNRWALIGRKQEVADLQILWEAARTGTGKLAFITGEPGIGKTSLAHDVAAQNQVPVLLMGRCQEHSTPSSYDLFANVLRAYMSTVPPEFTDERAQKLLGNLSGLVPELRHMLPGLSKPPALEPKQEQLRLMASMSQFIQHSSCERPWLLVLDDLQWIDEGSLELLRYLARHLPSMALLLIGIYRPGALDTGHPLLDTLSDLSSHPTYSVFELGRLTEKDVGQMLAQFWRQAVPKALTKKIFEHTAGNPFYVQEVAQGLSDRGLVTLEAGVRRFPLLEEIELPRSIHDAVWQRLSYLSADANALLRQAAVLGQAFYVDDLCRMSGLSEWEVLEQLDSALERDLIQEATGDGMLHFRQTDTHHVLYEGTTGLRRRLLHRRAAEALERRSTLHAEHVVTELAHHYREAGILQRAIHYSIQAAQQAENGYANESALMWYGRALDMFDELEPDESSQLLPVRLSAITSLGRVLVLVGRYNQALTQFASAQKLLETEQTSVSQAHQLASLCWHIADVHLKRSEFDAALECLNRGLSYLKAEEGSYEMARIQLLKAALYVRQGRFGEAQSCCRKALSVASEIGTHESQLATARSYLLLGRIAALNGELSDAIELCHKSVAVYETVGDRLGQSESYNNLGGVYFFQGDWARAGDAMHKSLSIKEEIGDIHGQGLMSNNLALLHLHRGDWDGAEGLFEQSQVIWAQIGATTELANTFSNLAQLHIYQKKLTRAEHELTRSQALFANGGSQEHLAELERRWGEYYLQTGALGLALQHTRHSTELAERMDNPLEKGLSLRTLGQIHQARDERELATESLHASLRILTDLNNEFEIARTRLALASLALETRSTLAAREHLSIATTTFERLGASANLATAREFAQRLQSQP